MSGGAGSVSQYVIQFAKAGGRDACSPPSPRRRKRKPAQEAGADHVIDYKRENVGERVMEITGKRGVDAVIEMDLAANAKLIPAVLRPKGSVIIYGTGPEATLAGGASAWSIRSACSSSWSMSSTRASANARVARHQRARSSKAR